MKIENYTKKEREPRCKSCGSTRNNLAMISIGKETEYYCKDGLYDLIIGLEKTKNNLEKGV